MVILRDANDAMPCDVDRLMVQVVTQEIAADAWRLLQHKMKSTSSRWSR